jgi:hypothetical protein
MSNDAKSQTPESQEPQQITPQTGELDTEQLGEVAAGNLSGSSGVKAPPPPPPII